MPYTNIVFVKLFLSLFEEDDRFLYQLNESQQLLYIKMLYLAGSTNNKITKNPRFICHKINYHHEEACFLADLERIKTVFGRFKENEEFYYFENFEDLHNWFTKDKSKVWSSVGSSQNKSKIKNKMNIPPTLEEVQSYCKERSNGVDPEKFINHYTAKGWLIGKNKMVDWKAAVRTWEQKQAPKVEMNTL